MVEFVAENQDDLGWIWHGCQRSWCKWKACYTSKL